MNFQLGPEIIASYKRLSYKAWYAFAEFVDNSTQSYFNNKRVLDDAFAVEGTKLRVEILTDTDAIGQFIQIKDNSIGMSYSELESAVIVGRPPINNSGRSKYGLGLKTAAFWFGDKWQITTKKLNEEEEITISFDAFEISRGNQSLPIERRSVSPQEHYTIITIRELNRKIQGSTIRKVKEHLSSFYRIDISDGILDLVWQRQSLTWSYDTIYCELLQNIDGEIVKKDFDFLVNGKRVRGWAGVYEKGSRSKAGFSILQANRVIIGYPESYRPSTIFGSQDGGSNDLVNQRLVGEIFLDGFDVSHTKDEILWTDEEKDEVEYELLERLSDLRNMAKMYRKATADEREIGTSTFDSALSTFEDELSSNEVKSILAVYEVPERELIQESNKSLVEYITSTDSPTIIVNLGRLSVHLYIVSSSPNDPYLIIESTASETLVIVIVNRSHPHWKQLKTEDSVLNFLRHCVYDGVAEWKTYFITHSLDTDTIKLIKDQLLRVPFYMEKHTA